MIIGPKYPNKTIDINIYKKYKNKINHIIYIYHILVEMLIW